MKTSRTRALLLWCAATDRTYSLVDIRGVAALAGKCIHCNTTLCIGLDGVPLSCATVEHIVPRVHGGGDDLDNLAIACARCNAEKGIRHDHKPWSDPALQALISTLKARRAARARAPLPFLALPPRPSGAGGEGDAKDAGPAALVCEISDLPLRSRARSKRRGRRRR